MFTDKHISEPLYNKTIRGVSILGSTGSIGTSTLKVIEKHRDLFNVVGLAANSQIHTLLEQVEKFKPRVVSAGTKEGAEFLKSHLSGSDTQVYYGTQGLVEVATHNDASFVMNAVVGIDGLLPTVEALKSNKDIGIANKESLIAAGHILKKLEEEFGCTMYPIDSEHSAIFQCLRGENKCEIENIILTASGGAFRDKGRDEMEKLTVKDALKHPNWKMGDKITVDCATLMNKGFEVIEAHWLFGIPYESIKVVIHPESIIHSMVEFVDGAIIAQLGVPDMQLPIQYALGFPRRLQNINNRLDIIKLGKLHFSEPDHSRFPCLKLAYDAGREGGSITTVLNAANEVANSLFRKGAVGFLDIEKIITSTLEKHERIKSPSLDEIIEINAWASSYALQISKKIVKDRGNSNGTR